MLSIRTANSYEGSPKSEGSTKSVPVKSVRSHFPRRRNSQRLTEQSGKKLTSDQAEQIHAALKAVNGSIRWLSDLIGFHRLDSAIRDRSRLVPNESFAKLENWLTNPSREEAQFRPLAAGQSRYMVYTSDEILKALASANGNYGHAAKLLMVDISTLSRWMNKLSPATGHVSDFTWATQLSDVSQTVNDGGESKSSLVGENVFDFPCEALNYSNDPNHPNHPDSVYTHLW